MRLFAVARALAGNMDSHTEYCGGRIEDSGGDNESRDGTFFTGKGWGDCCFGPELKTKSFLCLAVQLVIPKLSDAGGVYNK